MGVRVVDMVVDYRVGESSSFSVKLSDDSRPFLFVDGKTTDADDTQLSVVDLLKQCLTLRPWKHEVRDGGRTLTVFYLNSFEVKDPHSRFLHDELIAALGLHLSERVTTTLHERERRP